MQKPRFLGQVADWFTGPGLQRVEAEDSVRDNVGASKQEDEMKDNESH